MYLEVFNDNVVFIQCPLVFFVVWLSVCALVETGEYHASIKCKSLH